MNYIENFIENKRKEILNEADSIAIYARFIEFKKLYKKAIQSKEEKDVRKALKFYKDFNYEFRKVTYIDHKAKDLLKDLNSLLIEIEQKNAIMGKKKITVADIKRQLMIIVKRYNNDPKIIADLKKYKAKKFVCHIFEEYENEVYFEVSEDNQEIRINISGIIYDMAQDLEKALSPSISCDTGDGDEGCIYVSF